jgi:hypothetical protein
MGQEHKLTVWKLQRIMVCVRLVLIDLPEDSCGLFNGNFPAEGPARMATYIAAKASSVPGSTQTAVLTSSGAANPVVKESN